MENGGNDRLRLRIILRVVLGIIGGELFVAGAKAAGGVLDVNTAQQKDHSAYDADAEAPHQACLKALLRNKTAADAEIQLSLLNGPQDIGEIIRVVLAVSVHLHRQLIAVAVGIEVSALHAAADAKVDRK